MRILYCPQIAYVKPLSAAILNDFSLLSAVHTCTEHLAHGNVVRRY